jgi:hypothetical protein
MNWDYMGALLTAIEVSIIVLITMAAGFFFGAAIVSFM